MAEQFRSKVGEWLMLEALTVGKTLPNPSVQGVAHWLEGWE